MRNEFTAVIEQNGAWYIAYAPEIPGANGQGKTKAEALESLSAAIAIVLAQERHHRLDRARELAGAAPGVGEADLAEVWLSA